MPRRVPAGWILAIALGTAVLPAPATRAGAPTARSAAPRVTFVDVTAAAGIAFRHQSGAFGKKYLPETMGSGCAFADLDGDGWLDIVLVNATSWPGQPRKGSSWPGIYRNNGDGTFTDITKKAGLAVEFYGMGVSAADVDNDGDTDLYFTALGPNRLFLNAGNATFTDVTMKSGAGDAGFSTGSAWFDYDRDGWLDLYVANYVQWSIDKDLFCTLDGKTKSYCTPESYKGASGTLYRNRRDGTFEDVTKEAGLSDPAAKGLGVALLDFDGDNRLDLFVANDTQPNRLWRSTGDGTFVDVAVQAGVAFNEAGVARAGMGVDAADYDGSGRPSLVIGNFANEMMALYTNEGNGLFVDEAPASTIGQSTLLTLTFACFFFDADLDGNLDIFSANGHVADDIERVQQKVKYAQPLHLFGNLGKRRFEDASREVGPAFTTPIVGRGAAYGDYDNDGDLDLLVTTNNGPAKLLRNDRSSRDYRLARIRLRGTASNRDGIGAKVTARVADRPPFTTLVKTGSSYLSQSELAVTIGGLSGERSLRAIEVAWPSGKVDTVTSPPVNHLLVIEEGKGLADKRPLASAASRQDATPSRR